MKVRISAVIITLNEEQNIGRCLESLQGVADEFVVVDSYSNDRTEEICRSFGATFIQHRFFGHIEQKNWAILQASYPYVLSLDADEALSPELKASILEVKENWTHDGYHFNRLTSYCGKWIRHTSWYPSRKLRLWDSRLGSWGGLNPHDRFFLDKGASKKHLKGDLMHHSYYTVDEHLAQMNSFSTIQARSYFEQGRRANVMLIVLAPMWRFFRDYIWKLGFLDGFFGYVISANSAHEVFMKYVKLRQITREEKANKRPTICFVNTQRSWGGGEKWNLDVMDELKRQGYNPMFITSRNSPMGRRLSELGIPGYELRINRLKFLYPFKVFTYAKIFRREKVGVLLTNVSADMKTASLAAKMSGVRKIIYRRGSALPVENSIDNRYIFRRVLTKIIANSEETKRTILVRNQKLAAESKIKVIHNGIHLSKYSSDMEPLFVAKKDEIILGCAGRLSVEKGHHYLLEMMKYLNDNNLHCRLLLAGEGKLAASLREKADNLGVSHLVEFLGFVEEMPSFYSSIDIFLLPSAFEGFGYVLIEAMASRKPVVAFDVGSSREIVDHKHTGYLVPPGEVQEMATRVTDLAENKQLREKMGEQGQERVEELFSFEKSKMEIIGLLDPSVS